MIGDERNSFLCQIYSRDIDEMTNRDERVGLVRDDTSPEWQNNGNENFSWGDRRDFRGDYSQVTSRNFVAKTAASDIMKTMYRRITTIHTVFNKGYP